MLLVKIPIERTCWIDLKKVSTVSEVPTRNVFLVRIDTEWLDFGKEEYEPVKKFFDDFLSGISLADIGVLVKRI